MSSRSKIIILVLALGISFALIHNNIAHFKKEVLDMGHAENDSENLVHNFFNKTFQERGETQVYNFLVAGDIMLDRGVEAKTMNEGKGDWTYPFQLIAPAIQSADRAFANLEGSMSDVGVDGRGGKLSFRFHPQSALGLELAGIDVVSLANNHILDWGRASLCATPASLEKFAIASIGAGCNKTEAERPYITELGNTKIAVLASTVFYEGAHATETQAGIRKLDIQSISDQVYDLKTTQDVDLVFLSMHWGEEYQTRSNKAQQEFAHTMIDNGVDVIIGHHPHVPQEIERYGEKGWIIYSLGNFVFDQHFSEATMGGLMAYIQIQDKQVRNIIPFAIKINKNYQPYIEVVEIDRESDIL